MIGHTGNTIKSFISKTAKGENSIFCSKIDILLKIYISIYRIDLKIIPDNSNKCSTADYTHEKSILSSIDVKRFYRFSLNWNCAKSSTLLCLLIRFVKKLLMVLIPSIIVRSLINHMTDGRCLFKKQVIETWKYYCQLLNGWSLRGGLQSIFPTKVRNPTVWSKYIYANLSAGNVLH